jgi:hypothetical protein
MSGISFDNSRQADLVLEWLQQHTSQAVITHQMVSWLVHLCLRQMRLDILRSIQQDLQLDDDTNVLDDSIWFSYTGLSAVLPDGLARVSGNRSSFQTPRAIADTLFSYHDSQQPGSLENKPFRVLYQQICRRLEALSTASLRQVFISRLYRYLFTYHWVLPYPSADSLVPNAKQGIRRWFSVDIQPEPHGLVTDASSPDWCWARYHWRLGCPDRCLNILTGTAAAGRLG